MTTKVDYAGKALAALRRATKKAAEDAKRHGCQMVFYRDGRIVHVDPDEVLRQYENEPATQPTNDGPKGR